LTKVRSRLGVVKLYEQARQQKVKGFQGKFNQIRGDLKKEIGGQVRKTADVAELKKRLQEAGLIPQSQKKEDIQDIFKGLFAKGQEEKAPSVPSAMKRELAALGKQQPVIPPPRQLERSPGARTRTAPEVRRELANIVESTKKGSMDLMLDDISRIMRGSAPQQIKIASGGPGSSSGGTRWARGDAEDFDKSFKIYKRIRGDKDMIDWKETVRNGVPIGEGSFGSVLRSGNMAIKRGEVGAEEANIIKRVGQAGIGPKLHGAEISTKTRNGYGVDIHNGRIAMSVVPGKEMGDVGANTKFAGKNAADIYWKAMAELHRLGIAHNDAHPHNIMVDNTGKGRWVDMGLAQQSPKAALAEALGAFSRRSKGEGGNWQTRDWKATGIDAYRQAQTDRKIARFAKEHPVLGRVINNVSGVQSTLLRKYGLSPEELKQVMDHGIRSPLETYNRGAWAKLTDKQAQDLLNLLYDGI
jgi:tRNA A-37 threonylcarbamoyl transferase component Bud32